MLRAERATFAGNGLTPFRLLIAAFKPKVPAWFDRAAYSPRDGRAVGVETPPADRLPAVKLLLVGALAHDSGSL
jgi:hypothetical protein